MKLTKVLSLLLAFSMLLSVIPMMAFADTEVDPYNYVSDFPSEDDPTVTLYDEYVEGATYQWYEGETLLEGETASTLAAEMKFCATYSCSIVLADSTAFSVSFNTEPYIRSQPSQYSHYISVSHTDHVSGYQWYAHKVNDVAVTDENASNECKSCEGAIYSSYDSETDLWTATYMSTYEEDLHQLYCFEVELKAGEQLLIDADHTVTDIEIANSDLSLMECISYYLVGNIGVFTAEADDTYRVTVFTSGKTATVEAFIRTIEQDVKLAEETEYYLSDSELGNYYYCVVTYDNDKTLKSNTFLRAPRFYGHPDAEDRHVSVSDSEYASYQWYRIDEIVTDVNTENASAYEYTSTEASSYDSENGVWKGIETYSQEDGYRELAFFTISLEIGDVIRFKTDADVDYDELIIIASTDTGDFWYFPGLSDGECEYTAPYDATYTVGFATYDEGDVTLSAELIEYNDVFLEGETENILNKYIIGAEYYCEIAYPHCMVLTSESVEIIPEIIDHPTSEYPKFEVTYEDDAEFQWYEVTDPTFVTVDDTMVDTAYGTYDSETGEWTPDCGNPYDYYDYQEYRMQLFRIKLKAGEIVKVTISNPDAISPEDPNMRFNGYHSYNLDWNENGCIYFTSLEDDTYEVYQYAIYPETATFKVEKVSYTYTAIEGETDAVLSTMERGTLYAATATYDDGTVLNSKVFEAYPVITKQPTNDDPSVEMNIIEDGMKYQWYEMKFAASVLTDEDVSSAYGTYDPETQEWTGDVYSESEDGYYELDLFAVKMHKDEGLTFVPSEELYRGYIRVYGNGDYGEALYPNEDGSYTFTAPDNDEYYFYTFDDNESVTFKVSKNVFVREDAVEGETEAKLINPSRSAYQCVITYDEETELVSDVVALTPAITKQPTASDPSVEVNIKEDGMKYQWYEVTYGETVVTDQDVQLTDEDNPATYDSETQEWTPTIYDEYVLENGETEYELDLFIMALEEGQTVTFVPSEELNYNEIIVIQEHGSSLRIEVEEDGSYVFVAPSAQEYYFYFRDDNAEVSFKVTYEEYTIGDAIEGENEAKLSTRKQGYYVCVITYEDGTELVSDYVYLELPGDVNGDGDVNSVDYLLVKRACFNTYKLSEEEAVRADVNGDTNVNSTDYILIKRIAFGTYKA